MVVKTVFCEECRADVAYRIEDKVLTGTIKGEQYEYSGNVAYCEECNAEMYVPEVNDSNLEALYDVFREKNDLIPLSVIRQIPVKYNIEIKSLSKLLGWKEQTYSRYIDGDVPSKEHSDILKKMYESPTYYESLLRETKQ